MKKIFKVVNCGEVISVQSQKAEGGMLKKRVIVLQEVGGKYENSYVCTMLGNLAECVFYPDNVVYGVLRFQAREYNGQFYQDVVAVDLISIHNA